tara:strand:- start:121633 stop:123507 length:1875 start_codon:yes stop_codon:yes gene_type:complete
MLKREILKIMRRYGYTALRIDALERERDDNARAHQELLALQGELDAVRGASQAVIAERDEISANLARQNQEIDTVIAQRDTSEAQQASLTAQLSESQSQIALAEKRGNEVRADVVRLEAALRRKQLDVDRLSREIDGYSASNAELAAQMRDLKKDAEKQLESERRSTAAQLRDLKNEAEKQLESEQRSAAAQIRDLKNEAEKQLESERRSTAAQLRDLKNEAEKQLAREQRSAAALSEQIERLEKEIAAQQEMLDARADVQAELEALRKEIVDLNERLKVAQYSKRRDRLESKQLKDELEEVRADSIANRVRLEQVQSELLAAQNREVELNEAIKLQNNSTGESDQSVLEQRFLQLITEHETALTELAETYDKLEGSQAGWKSRSWGGGETQAQDQQASDQTLPKNIVIAGLPYSRADELAGTIRNGGLHEEVPCCGMLFPNDILSAGAFAGEGRYFAHTYLDASPRNLESLKEAAATTIVYVSDPRQVVVRRSLAVSSQYGESLQVEPGISPALADGETLSMEKLIDLQAAYFVPHIAAWIEGWLAYIDGRPNWPIFLTTDDMLGDESFNTEMVEHLGLGEKSVENYVPEADDVSWRDVLTSEQSETILAAVPERVRKRFNWV